jgi:hypothetical protein
VAQVNARLRLRSPPSFHRDSYIYYCKQFQKWAWNPMRPVFVEAWLSVPRGAVDPAVRQSPMHPRALTAAAADWTRPGAPPTFLQARYRRTDSWNTVYMATVNGADRRLKVRSRSTVAGQEG